MKTATTCWLLVGLVIVQGLATNATAAGTLEMAIDLRWEARYDGPVSRLDRNDAFVLSPDGATVFVTGQSEGAGTGWDYATVAFDTATGSRLWASRYDGPISGVDRPAAIALSPGGSTVFVTGASEGPGRGRHEDYATVAYDALSGEPVWVARYDFGADYDAASSIAVSPDGSTVFVTGTSRGYIAEPADFATIAYDAATGNPIWSRRFDGPGSLRDQAVSIVVGSDGSRVFVTGNSEFLLYEWGFATVTYDALSGEQLWETSYEPAFRVHSLAVSPDASTVFVAYGTGIIAYDAATGGQVWHDETGSGAFALEPSPDSSMLFGTGDSTVACNAATGDVSWSELGGFTLALNGDGSRLFVTSGAAGLRGYDTATGEEFLDATVPLQVEAIEASADGMTLYAMRDAEDYSMLAYDMFVTAAIDVEPDYPVNYVSPSSSTITVALLGSARLDVRRVDGTSLRLGPASAGAQHDLADAFTYGQHLRDVNQDGYVDLVAHFSPRTAGIVEGMESVTLEGRVDGLPLKGTDSITVLRPVAGLPAETDPPNPR